MNELLTHLTNGNLSILYEDKASKTSDYGNLTAFVYKMLKRAIQENADTMLATTQQLVWSRNGKVIYTFDETVLGESNYPINYANPIRKILEKDSIVKKWTRIVSDSDDTLILQFLP